MPGKEPESYDLTQNPAYAQLRDELVSQGLIPAISEPLLPEREEGMWEIYIKGGAFFRVPANEHFPVRAVVTDSEVVREPEPEPSPGDQLRLFPLIEISQG